MDKKSGGFTLIEIIVVIAILGIIAAIAVPRVDGFTSMAKERVCVANRKTIEIIYASFLAEKNLTHSDSVFNQFLLDNLDEICPSGGVITYEDGKVKCDVYVDEGEPPEEDSPGKEIPWL
jgi:prepilin-type N-terminal cleavage/methylation domain-containing protein